MTVLQIRFSFSHQLLLPIHKIDRTNVANDPRKSFYPEVNKFTNSYAYGELGLSDGYGHNFTHTTSAELLRWDGTIVMDGVRGGGGAILSQFDRS